MPSEFHCVSSVLPLRPAVYFRRGKPSRAPYRGGTFSRGDIITNTGALQPAGLRSRLRSAPYYGKIAQERNKRRGSPFLRAKAAREVARIQKIITVCSGKGGVGKSTVACCCAAAVVCRRRRVLLIDADQGLAGLDILLGVVPPPVFDICDAAQGRCAVSKVAVPCEMLAGLNLACAACAAGKRCTAADLSKFCGICEGQYDYIIIDAPAGIGEGFRTAVAACDEAVIVSTPDEVSMRAAARAGIEIEKAGKPDRLIINKYDRRLSRRGTAPSLDELIDTVLSRLLGVIPYDPEFARLARKSVLLLPRRAVSVRSFYNIAARICGEDVPLAQR